MARIPPLDLRPVAANPAPSWRLNDNNNKRQISRAVMSTLMQLLTCASLALACDRVYFGEREQMNLACRCRSAADCDRFAQFEWPRDPRTYLRVVSSKAGDRFARDELRVATQNVTATATSAIAGSELSGAQLIIEVLINRRAQQVLGFGGALTDSALQVLSELPDELRRRALLDYFGADGLDYNMGRVPIAGTDMSTRPYTYDDLAADEPDDLALAKFQLQREDLELKIPAIKLINEWRAERRLSPLKLMAASWSAPAWMKSNQCLVQGRLRGNSSSRPSYYDAYARYVIRFLHDYERLHNISMWALSAQNEPYSPKRVGPLRINFNSVNFEPAEMADYLANSLVPALERAGKTPDKLKLFIWDDTLDGLARYQEAALASKSVRDFTLGLAIHWYSTGMSGRLPYEYLRDVRRRLPPQMLLMSTEASFIGRPRAGDWSRGERYALDVIENLRAGSVSWLDWNLALNVSGGPTWSGNILDSAMLVDTERSAYLKNPMFYALGHLTRFVRPNSHVVQSRAFAAGNSRDDQMVAVVAAELDSDSDSDKNNDNDDVSWRKVALVALNRANERRTALLKLPDCRLKEGVEPLRLELAPNSVTSLAFMC